MRHEEQLDRLLEQSRSGQAVSHDLAAEDEAKLAAAASFARLNEIAVPSDMVERIEDRVQARVRSLQRVRVARQIRPQPHVFWQRPFVRRAWVTALAAALLLFAYLSVSSVAANSLPGDPLYAIKRLEQQGALAQTRDQATRASLQVTQLQSSLADLTMVVQEKRSDATISEALNVVATNTTASQNAITALPAGSQRETLAQSLTSTITSERTTLHRFLAQVDWSQRLAFTHQLGSIGEQVPVATHVTIAGNAGTTLTVTVTGKNFAPGAHLVIDGTPRGAVRQSTTTSLKVTISASDLPDGEHTVGVINPDGTAAQIPFEQEHHQPGQPGPGDHHGMPGAGPTSTPGTENGHRQGM